MSRRLDGLLTARMRTLMAGLGQSVESLPGAAALAGIRDLVAHDLVPADDAGTTMVTSFDDGVRLRVHDGVLVSITFEVQQNPEFAAFTRIGELVEGLSTPTDLAAGRAVVGEPLLSEYRNDKYLVGEIMVVLTYRPDGSLQRLSMMRADPDHRRRLERALKKAGGAGQPSGIEISDEDGILALIDPATFRSRLPDWWFGTLTARFTEEMNAQHGIAWMTGAGGHGEWRVEFRSRASSRPAFREARHTIEVTDGRLQLVTYGELTIAAEEEDVAVPVTEATGRDHRIANGRYGVRLRQLFDPDDPGDSDELGVFEIVLTPAKQARRSATAPIWWETTEGDGDQPPVPTPPPPNGP